MLYSYYLKPLLYTIDKCIVGRYIFIVIFNCLRILTRAFVYISYFDAARWRADTEITQKSSSAASILLSSMVLLLYILPERITTLYFTRAHHYFRLLLLSSLVNQYTPIYHHNG